MSKQRAVRRVVSILVTSALLAPAAAMGGGYSSESRCDGPYPFDPPRFSDKVHAIDERWSGSHSPMPRADAERLLKGVWRKLYERCHGRELSRKKLRYRVAGNMRQIASDSAFIPAARSPTGQHAKGLLQLIDPVFEHWHVPRYDNVYHPLDDLIAAVNIQLNADTVISVVDEGYVYPHNVLNGRHSGWGFHGGDNPYRPFQ